MKTCFQQIRWQIFVVTVLLIIFSPMQTRALEVETHRAINEKNAAKGSFLHQYLIDQLGLKDGVETEINKKWIIKWLGDGGVNEDNFGRYFNHFYNPLRLNNSGLLGNISAKDWAIRPVGNQYADGQYSWFDARDYYLKALTSTDRATRENNFAETFRAIGQVMHLVQDMSVSAHTRDDVHPTIPLVAKGDPYEKWAQQNINQVAQVNTYSVYNYTPYSSSFLIPQLFDTEQYNGGNPAITISSSNIGLAEYTNANFLSAGSIFKNFDYPAYKPGISMADNIITISNKEVLYLKKIGEGETINYFARAGRFYKKLPAEYKSLELTVKDNKVHENYAQLLVPRAVGYSSQVLSYFFRGEIEAKLLPVFDEANLYNIHIKVRNITPTKETMGGADSVFLLAYRYTPPGAPADGSGDTWSKVPFSYPLSSTLLYGKDDNGNDLEGEAYETEIYFSTFPLEIPIAEYPNVKFMLIYRGNLGEEKADIATGVSGGIIGKFGVAKPMTFHEECNTAPKGDYNWFQMESTIFGTNFCSAHNIEHGLAQNDISGGKLIKTNIRYPITSSGGVWEGGHFNSSHIGVHSISGNTYANNIFPIPITKNTHIEFKIDEMTISPSTFPGGFPRHYQYMELAFNNGYYLQFSLGDQFQSWNNTGYFTFTAGAVMLDNIHKLLKLYNFPIPDDLKLNYISLRQQIGYELPLDTQFEQRMVVDFIRVVEMEKMEPAR